MRKSMNILTAAFTLVAAVAAAPALYAHDPGNSSGSTTGPGMMGQGGMMNMMGMMRQMSEMMAHCSEMMRSAHEERRPDTGESPPNPQERH